MSTETCSDSAGSANKMLADPPRCMIVVARGPPQGTVLFVSRLKYAETAVPVVDPVAATLTLQPGGRDGSKPVLNLLASGKIASTDVAHSAAFFTGKLSSVSPQVPLVRVAYVGK